MAKVRASNWRRGPGHRLRDLMDLEPKLIFQGPGKLWVLPSQRGRVYAHLNSEPQTERSSETGLSVFLGVLWGFMPYWQRHPRWTVWLAVLVPSVRCVILPLGVHFQHHWTCKGKQNSTNQAGMVKTSRSVSTPDPALKGQQEETTRSWAALDSATS